MVNPLRRIQSANPLLPIHAGILVTFALIPVWFRFKPSPGPFDALYSTGFLIFWPMVWTVAWWLILRLPGFGAFRRDRLRCIWALILLLLSCWAFLSWSWAYTRAFRPAVAIGGALPFALTALFALVIACAGPRPRSIIKVLIVGMIVSSAIAGWQVARQGPVNLGFLGEFNINPDNSGVSIVQVGAVRWLRPYGLLPHPNILAGYLTIGLLCCVVGILSERRRIRWISIAVFLFGLWALMLTFSRSAWIGFAAGGFALLPYLWSRLKMRHLRLTLIAFGISVIVAGSLFVVLYKPFLAARTGEGDESVELRSISDRVVYNEMAYRAIAYSPIVGVGMSNFPWIASYYLSLTTFDLRGQPVHQILLSAWSELGVVGYVLTAGALILGVEIALRTLRQETNPDRLAQAAMLCGVIALMLIGLLDHYPWTLLHFQVAWWGLLAAAGQQPLNSTRDSPSAT
ncbi:MAG: O-antigen ligase family protein [Chloroflexota bacterium]